ncbi:unnamed protein product [Didymodactylos carnosus]|uniref:N-acetyltransferase domain-containing protein n=1 Tax=Didymodactylos carnosus TaxID=1234261 RepID=A0A814V2H0_9BILA|nr:unnamed protein product [Didymodactylos carnosus]CAF1183195.1 unnamed protein product [Didymodactylos carnosus]CAF3754748.1 unnamed protein product [Didymodactylos carnosus]CAF3947507.1 unnamed protein product [Didymodactylos carnosus]
MAIRLNTTFRSSKDVSISHIQYGTKDDVGYSILYHFFTKAFPGAFNKETFLRVFDASDISKVAYMSRYCCTIRIYCAVLATSIFADNTRRLKILMLVEDDNIYAYNLGKKLINDVIRTCRENENFEQIEAFVESSNNSGINFYKTIGFNQVHHVPDYFPRRASLTPEAVKLVYPLKNSATIEPASTSDLLNTFHEVRLKNIQFFTPGFFLQI